MLLKLLLQLPTLQLLSLLSFSVVAKRGAATNQTRALTVTVFGAAALGSVRRWTSTRR